MIDRPPQSILLCTTPRSGSTLVCALLRASGRGGAPESWYRPADRDDYAADWGIARADGSYDPAAYRAAAIAAGQGPDGTFGLRLQADALAPLLAELGGLYPGVRTDRAVLEAAFGPCQFVYVRRRDSVAQAVSRLKAEQTQIWHYDGTEPDRAAAPLAYDAHRIDAFREEAARGNAAWEDWFRRQNITPQRLVYEDFAPRPAEAVRALLAALGRPLPAGTPLTVPNRRMSDATSADWAARYRADRATA